MSDLLKDGILEVLKSPINWVVREVGEEFKHVVCNQLLEYQVKGYERNSSVKTVLFGSDPKPLYEVYYHLKVRKANKSTSVSTEKVKELFKKEKFITILGDAGSGKSMLLKHLYVAAIEEKFRFPIKVEMRYLNQSDRSLYQYVSEEYFKFHDLAHHTRIIDRLLSSGRFVFLFDGYDEVKIDRQEEVTRELNEFVKKYEKNKYIVTSRLNTGAENLPLFHNYYIQAFKDNEVISFVNLQMAQNQLLAEDIVGSIRQQKNEAYLSYLRNPLLLTMFILSYNNYSDLPPKRSIFYRQVFDTLFIIHDSRTKHAFKRERSSGLSKDQFEEVLRIISFISYFEYKLIFSREEMSRLFSVLKKARKDISFENESMLYDLTVSVGIMTKEGLDYSFSHRSLQEYFAASYIADLKEEHKKEIYQKLEDKIVLDKMLWVEYYSNFCLLLMELDLKIMVKEFLLPVLNTLKDVILPNRVQEMYESETLTDFFQRRIWLYGLFFEGEDSFDDLRGRTDKLYLRLSNLDNKLTFNKVRDRQKVKTEIDDILVNEVFDVLEKTRVYLEEYIDKKEREYSGVVDGDIDLLKMI